MSTALWHCASCGTERTFEQPPCLDGHAEDCPEWCCVECGHAIVVAFDVDVPDAAAAGPGTAGTAGAAAATQPAGRAA